MPKLNALNQQVTEVDMAAAPEQFGDYAPPPQPGRGYGFMLPRFDPDTDWHEYDADENRRRLALQFGGRKEGAVPPLTVVDSPTGLSVGDPVNARLTNEEKKFASAKDGESAVSPMHYLMVALGEDPSGWSNLKFADGLIRHSSDKFRARVLWTAYCNPKNDIYAWDESRGKSVEQEGQPGCGTRWGLTEKKNAKGETTYAIPRKTEEGREHEYENRFTCHCGASLGVFVDLQNFQPFEGGVQVAEIAAEQGVEVHKAPSAEVVQPPVKQTAPQAPKPNGPVAQTKPSQTPVAGKAAPAAPAAPVGGPPKPSAPRPAAAPAKK